MEINDKIKGLLWGLLLWGLLTLLFGCRTKYVAVPEVHVRDSVQMRYVRDSVFLHDSVFVNQYRQGDTVYLTSDRWRTMYRDRFMRDTVTVVRHDSVPVVYDRFIDGTEGKGTLKWYERLLMYVGAVAVCAGLAWIFLKLRIKK